MNLLDFIIFFIWVFIFYILIAIRRRRYQDPFFRKHIIRAFWVKVLATLCYSFFVLYLSPGDTTLLYFPEAANIRQMILKDPSKISILFHAATDFDQTQLTTNANLGYFDTEGNFMVTRIAAIFSFFTFGKFLATNLFFSMFALTGAWELFRFFYNQYPNLKRQIAIATLYLPSLVFWGAGILKDPLCTGSIGFMTYAIFNAFVLKKHIIKNIITFSFFSWLLYIVKSYIFVSYLPFLILFLVLTKLALVKNILLKAFIVLLFITGSVFAFLRFTESERNIFGNFATQGIGESVLHYQREFQQKDFAESTFSLGVEFDGSIISLIKIGPAAIVATLFRPFIWESRKISTLLSSLESLVLMLFTAYVLLKVGLFKFIGAIFRSPIIMYCFTFSILFSLFVGATTLNFGSLVRYKIPGMSFFIMSLFLILDIYKKEKKNKELKNNERVTIPEV